MGRGKYLSAEKQRKLAGLTVVGLNVSKIARSVTRSPKVVTNYLKLQFCCGKSHKTGRPPKLSPPYNDVEGVNWGIQLTSDM